MRTGRGVFTLAALAALTAVVLAVPTTASAEQTALCAEEESPCAEPVEHIHAESVGHAKLLSSFATVECEVLFLGDTLEGGLGSPLKIHGTFTYTCLNSCTATEENGPAEIKVLRDGTELAKATGEGLVFVSCGLSCRYNGVGLSAHVKGALTATNGTGEIRISGQILNKESGFLCPKPSTLDIALEPLEELYLTGELGSKTAICTTDEATSDCTEEHKPASVDLKDSAVEFLTNILNSKCEGLISGTIGAAGKPQVVKVESKYSGCTNSCTITEISGGSNLLLLKVGESSELANVATEGLELFLKCGSTVKCAFGPVELSGHALGALATEDNGHVTFSNASLGTGEGLLCPSEASIDALFVASSAIYVRGSYVNPPTSLCSKDEKSPFCKSENQLKTIAYKDKAVEILTSLINVKCEGLASGTVGEPSNPLEIKAELTYTGCSEGCFVTSVAGPGVIVLQREGKAEEANATSEGFEIFVKCGTTIKCLLGPEAMTGQALGALTTGDNGHLTFSEASMGEGEGATCPKEATLDALYVASSAAYIG